MTINWRPDLMGKPSIYHLIRAGLLQPNPADEMGMYGSSGIDPQGRMVYGDSRTGELYTAGAPIGDEGETEKIPYDPANELGITAMQQAGFLQEDQANAAALPDIIAKNNEMDWADYSPLVMSAIMGGAGLWQAAGSLAGAGATFGDTLSQVPTAFGNKISGLGTSLSDLLSGGTGGIDALQAGQEFGDWADLALPGSDSAVMGVGTTAPSSSSVDMTGFMSPDPLTGGAPADLLGNPYDLSGAGLDSSYATGGLYTPAADVAGGMLNLANSVPGNFVQELTKPSSWWGTAKAAAGGATTLSSLLKSAGLDTGEYSDIVDGLGRAIPGLIGAYAANQQGDAIGDLGAKEDARIREFMTYGAPSRERYEASFAPGFDITQDPALTGAMDTTMDTMLRRLSAQGGNPFGNPSGLAEANKYVMGNVALPYLQNYRNQNASTGGYGAFNTTAAGGGNTNALDLAGVKADSGMWGALGGASRDALTPPQQPMTLEALLNSMKGSGVGPLAGTPGQEWMINRNSRPVLGSTTGLAY